MAKQAKVASAAREGRRVRRRQLRRQQQAHEPFSDTAIHARNIPLRAVTAKNIQARWTKEAQEGRFAAEQALRERYEGEGAWKLLTEEEMVRENGGRGVGVEDAGVEKGKEWKDEEEEGETTETEAWEDNDEEMEEGEDMDVEEETAGPGNVDPNWMPALPERMKESE